MCVRIDAEKSGHGSEVEELEEDDDELTRRVEDFIHKINSGWMAERLRAYDKTL